MKQRDYGFTLIELVVLLMLLGIMGGLVALNLGGDYSADVRKEAERLALLIRSAQEEAILQGRIFAVSLENRGYHFLRLDNAGSLKRLEQDDVFKSRELKNGISIDAVEIAGFVQEKSAGIVLNPSGDVPDFTITLLKGTARWYVIGSNANGIRPIDTLEDRAPS